MFDQDQRDVVKGTVVPIPSKQTAGVYIFQSVYGHTVVGPTNVRQASKTDRAVGPIFSQSQSKFSGSQNINNPPHIKQKCPPHTTDHHHMRC